MITPTEVSAGDSGFTIKGEAEKAMAYEPIEASCPDRSPEDGDGIGTVQVGKTQADCPEHVVEQLVVLVNRHGRKNIWFGDDCFNVDRDHVAAICEGILERGIDVNWYYQGRADLLVKHQDLLPLAIRSRKMSLSSRLTN